MSKITDVLSYKYFKSGSAWIILILGIGLYIVGFFVLQEHNVWKEVCIKIADVFVIGVILGYLSNAAQFLGVFKQDIQDIIYGKEFIKQRKELYPLWETVSKEMFKNKFPSIHKDFLKTINGYMVFFVVNGKNEKLECDKEYMEEDVKCEEYSIKLHGANKYSIKYKREKEYDLKTDFILGFRAKYIVNGLRVRIDCPEDISLFFTCRGTQNDFEDLNTKKHSIEKKYKGIILPRQGYICALQKNK